MSRYCGKCDLYDSFCNDFEDESFYDNLNIYFCGSPVPLNIKSYKDLTFFFPFIVAVSFSDSKTGKQSIEIGGESYINTHERELLQWYMNDIKKVYRRCKRKHEPFTENSISSIYNYKEQPKIFLELYNEVKEHGEQAEIPKTIGLESCDKYRKKWCEEIIKAGNDPLVAKLWVYGWCRRKVFDEQN